MAEIAGILGREEISIASVIQHESEEEEQGVVSLVFMTHNASEGAMRAAMEAIDVTFRLRASRAACGCAWGTGVILQ